MSFENIIWECHFDKNNWENPTRYFERKLKKAQEEGYDSEEFFNGCHRAINSYEEQISSAFNREMQTIKDTIKCLREGKGYFPPPGVTDEPVSWQDYDGPEYQKEKRKEQLEIWEQKEKTFSIDDVNIYKFRWSDLLKMKSALNAAQEQLELQQASKALNSLTSTDGEANTGSEISNSLLNIFKEESGYNICLTLLKELEIIDKKTLECIIQGKPRKGYLIFAAIDALKNTTSDKTLLARSGLTDDDLLNAFNSFLGTTFVQLKRDSKGYKQTLARAKEFISNSSLKR